MIYFTSAHTIDAGGQVVIAKARRAGRLQYYRASSATWPMAAGRLPQSITNEGAYDTPCQASAQQHGRGAGPRCRHAAIVPMGRSLGEAAIFLYAHDTHDYLLAAAAAAARRPISSRRGAHA